VLFPLPLYCRRFPQDDGDPAKEVSPRDIVYCLEADAAAANGCAPRQIASTDLRFGGISWCNGDLALLVRCHCGAAVAWG
jgi:hypothetical protein